VIRRLVLVFVTVSVYGFAQSPARGHFESKFENDVVAVYEISLAPGETASAFQSAHDTVWLSLADATVTFASGQTGKTEARFAPGDARFFSSFETRSLRNTGAEVFRGLMIALKARGLVRNGCECTGNTGKAICGCTGAGHLDSLWAFSLGDVTLAGTSLMAGEAFRSASIREDMLLLAITDLTLADEANPDAETGNAVLRLKVADAVWINGGRHKLKNIGREKARFVTLEF